MGLGDSAAYLEGLQGLTFLKGAGGNCEGFLEGVDGLPSRPEALQGKCERLEGTVEHCWGHYGGCRLCTKLGDTMEGWGAR